MAIDFVTMHKHAAADALRIPLGCTFIGKDNKTGGYVLGYKMLRRIDGEWYATLDLTQPFGAGKTLPLALQNLRQQVDERGYKRG